MNINKVSQSISSQSPEFLSSEYPLFNKFIEYYYKSQEKTGLGQNIINNFLQYLDIDKLDIGILDGATKIVESFSPTDDTIVVESVDSFLKNDGSIIIGDEVIYYENTTSAPDISLSPGITYDQVKLKWTDLAQLINQYDGTTVRFPLTSQSTPIPAPSAQHLVVTVYGKTLIPTLDYTVDGTDIVFTTAPRAKQTGDDASDTNIFYLGGFIDSNILALDNISGSFGDNVTEFMMTRNGTSYSPIVDEYIIAIYDNVLLVPRVDYFIDGDTFIFNVAPLNGRFLSLYSIEAPIPSFGSGAIGYARVDNLGQLSSISINKTGSSYRYEYPPQVTISGISGSGASATTLVNGIKNAILLDGGTGYSDTNPPIVEIESPTAPGSTIATLKASVSNGTISDVEIVSSGSGYTFNPRITFKQPGGAKLGSTTIVSGSLSGTIPVLDGGQGYTTQPLVYIDEPDGSDGIRAALRAELTDGKITSITVLNAGQGYISTPRVSIIDPTGAQVLETLVDSNGRVVSVELLDGGSGYTDIPSVYIVDPSGNGTGAEATASIFNGKITDINISNFGSGYSLVTPPNVIIQSPPEAKASVEPGLNEVTGFKVNKTGKGYKKAQFEGCARAASGITGYTESGNAIFSNNTTASSGVIDASVKCLDSLFVKRLLDKYTEQFLPDVPELDYTKIDVRTAIKSVKDFYSTKGTSYSIAYLFKLLYGEEVTISYPKDQITKPSAATWSIDTILRATLVSGDPTNIKDGLLIQEENIADVNIEEASALIENYISIKTSNLEIFELVLSEETINGVFTVPYKTKLAEPLGTENSIITVDSTIGWPERNGEFIIGGSEVVQYKEKSLNQFIECTRSVNNIVEDWDSATEVASNLVVYINKGTAQEVVMNIVGIVDAQQTTLTDTGSYYLTGDKLSVSKLGGTSVKPELNTWLYNVKKLLTVSSITYGGVNNQFATVTCENSHGVLVGDQVTVYGSNPILYNGSFVVTSRDSATVFQYQLPQPAEVTPQGNILVSVDLNKGKSENTAINKSISPYTTNIQNSFFNDNYVYVASTGIPNYNIGPFPGSALLPGNQRKLNRFPLAPSTISTKNAINPGSIGTWVNGVSIWSYKSTIKKTFGPLTSISIIDQGKDYDAAFPPLITISGGGGSGADASVVVDGSITEIIVNNSGSGYITSPLVSIVGGGGSGAAATAIVTKGVVSRILMNSGGTGYISQPSITIVGGSGTGATATASVRGPIKSISVNSGGSSYTSTPDITLSSGVGAVAQAIVQNGRIISIAIISAGQGYTTAPEVTIQGDGFGAVARATIDTDGENAGRVTGIEILNRGINYVQGSTIIGLNSIGQDAKFTANVFQWTYNLQETTLFDSAKGSVFAGLNNQYGGEYAHLSNPQQLRYILGDNLFVNNLSQIKEQDTQLSHSPIIGWSYDGNPIYGPYGYSDPTNQSSSITRMNTSFSLKTELIYDQISNPYPVRTAGPLLTDEVAGKFVEDYEYSFGSGDLDQYNGRFCKTPEFPEGRYCYFVTVDATEDGNPIFPYVLGPSYNSAVDIWNLSENAIQQNIPTGVVRFRDPYENVDIDVDRAPNASTNALTLENGDILLFDIEDENRDGIISQDETDDPDQIFEESPLQLFDYFPKVRLDSKVDIEVETITKFEDAAVTGFTIEDAGSSYQVDDIIIFDNTGTDGTGVSARVSRVTGEALTSYSFENIEDTYYGVLTTTTPHNIIAGDKIFVDYNPIMDTTNKQFVVRQLKGVEEIVINQTGSGYDDEIPPTIKIDGDGNSAALEAVVSQVGSIDVINIVNSGSSYVNDPRVIISHPQIFKKSDYFVSLLSNQNYVKINDSYITETKEFYVCGKTIDASSNEVAFVAKFSELGVKEWEKSLESQVGETYTEFIRMDVRGNSIWLVGENKPNSSILSVYNPDIFLAKYTQAEDGLSATLDFQKGYAGISGSTRSDYVTSIKSYSDSRYIIGGYTNTNSTNPFDAFIASIDSTGGFAAKRKIATASLSEKLTDLIVIGDSAYFILETAASSSSADIKVALGKATIGTAIITIDWIKEIGNSVYSLLDSSLVVDEFNEMYITATTRLKSDNTTKDGFWVGKFDINGSLLWNYRYGAPAGTSIQMVNRSAIDIFGDLNVAYTRTDTTTGYRSVDTIKIDYDGKMVKQTNNAFTINNIEGLNVHALVVDSSGDVYPMGQTSWNRNEFIFDYSADLTTDLTSHYTPTVLQVGDSVRYLSNAALIQGYQTASPSSWENSAIKIPAAQLGTKLADDWTCEFMLYKNGSEYNTHSQTQVTLMAIGDSTVSTGGLWMYYDLSSGRLELVVSNNTTALNAAGSALQSTQTNMFADNNWQFIGLKKEGDVFTGYVNGTQVFTGTITSTSLGSKDMFFGNIPGRSGTLGQFRSNEQLQGYLDNIRLKNRAITPTAPSDASSLPSAGGFSLTNVWNDATFFTNYIKRYDYIDYVGWILKTDKNSDATRLGSKTGNTNTGVAFTRTEVTPVTETTLTVTNIGLSLGGSGLQNLDYDDSTINMFQDSESITLATDIWSSRTATVPSPGSQKLSVTAKVKNRYYMKVTNTVKIDNVQELTINQDFNFTVGSKLKLSNDSGTFVNSGYILSKDTVNDKVYLAVNNNSWSNDLNTGNLTTEQFNEESTYGIVGSIPNDVNVIKDYIFTTIQNTTPGTFDIALNDFNLNRTVASSTGAGNLDDFAKFRVFDSQDTENYRIRIDTISGSSTFIPGSVVTITNSQISFNSDFTTCQITGLTGVLTATIITTLDKVLQCTAVANTDEVYVITSDSHYLSNGENIFVDGNPTQEVGSVAFDEYDGSFVVNRVVSSREFVYKLAAVAQTDPATSASSVSIFAKSPVLKMYYGHQYLFDLSHSSMLGTNLSFSKDNLFKLEYSFNSIERIGTPGVTGEGQSTPTVKLKVDNDIVTNISYYFDPSRLGDDSPVSPGSYLDIVNSPYVGTFTVSSVTGETITTGPVTMKFPLINEPEGNASISRATYSTSSKKAVSSISDIRIVNSGGFYSKIPVITGIQSTRQIERVQIEEPGTEYAVGVYRSIPIGGDGEGGLVEITVADGTTDEGVVIPGQIQKVAVTSPGKGYTIATVDIESIPGILGSGLEGSGAVLSVVIPPSGSGAVVFAQGDKIGKIKKLKNNNFGYDYSHDYTLRPEITFPINAQLTSTNILDSITVTDPGSGYSQAPAVVIVGGGGSGALAEATIKNGRIDQVIVKDPGAGYSSAPTVSLKSSFNYVVNIDLGLLQFAFPHGIQSGAEVTLNAIDNGDGLEFPLAAGALGRLNGATTYYAIAGAANSLETDQLKLAITPSNAELGDAISYVNSGSGRQQVLTESFGAAATANVITSTFLEGELVYQGPSLDQATATGFVSTNSGWQVGPRIVKIVDYVGAFSEGESITGVISKSSGVISDLNIAKGVLEIGSITKTTGQFIDDVGKPSEIIQKIQDSYYYQDFSYAVQSSVSIDDWKEILIKNVHPASFKVFGELNLNEYSFIPNKETDFELTKSVELARDAIVPNIQSFALAEPIYSEFNNTEVLFRQKRLTSSENILTSVVQRLDDVSSLFDGERTAFPLSVNGDGVIANASQILINLNGVAQTPNKSFTIVGDSIVFSEPPQPPASVKYVNVTVDQINTKRLTFSNVSGIFPVLDNTLVGIVSLARLTVIKVEGNDIIGFVTEGTFQVGELCQVSATGFSGTLDSKTDIINNGLFEFNETISNTTSDTAKVERINLETGQENPIAKLRYTIGAATTTIETVDASSATDAPVPAGTFVLNETYQIGSEIVTITDIINNSESTTVQVIRSQLGTTSISHQEDTPFYGTDINITNTLTLSKTAGTYQSTPGLFDIQLNDVIVGAKSSVVARITSTSAYQDPSTNEFIEQVNISDGSSFFGILFNRRTSTDYPNIILDDISTSQVNIVDFTDTSLAFNSDFPNNEIISNNILSYDNVTGTFQDNEVIRNYRLNYSGNTGDFASGDELAIRKLTFTDKQGSGFFREGDVIRTRDTKAEIIGFSQARDTIYLGKIGRCQRSGADYHKASFVKATLNTYNKKYGSAALALSPGTSVHAFVSGVTDAITVTGGGSGPFTAATGTTYDPFSGNMVIEIGTHSLTTSDSVTIANDGVVFTCAQDNNTSNKAYPRSTDPASGSARNISAVSATTITIDVGAVPIDEYVTVPTSTEFGFGTGEFTVECWVKPNSIAAGSKAIFDMRTTGTEVSPYVYLDGANLKVSVNGSVVITGTTNLAANTYYHVALCRSGSTTKLFLNGTQEGSDFSDGGNYGSTKPFTIGAAYDTTSDVMPGYIDDFRVSTVARYTSTFTAPKMHQGDTDTVLLLSFDGIYNSTYTQDWSGAEAFTNYEYFNNDAITETSKLYGGIHQFVSSAANALTIDSANETPTDATYNASTGDLTLTIGSHSYTTSSTLTIAANSLTFTCDKDDFATNHTYPRSTDSSFGATLNVTAVTATTITVNVGYPFKGYEGRIHRYYNAADLIESNLTFVSREVADRTANSLPYQLDTTSNPTIVRASDYSAYSYYGGTVSVGTNKIVTGSWAADDSGSDNRGAIYISDLDGGNEIKVFAPTSLGTNDRFGYSVGASSKIIVGVPYNDANGSQSGSAVIFDEDGTNPVVLAPSDASSNKYFGWSCAADTKFAVGAYGDTSFQGAVYVYDLDGTNEVKVVAAQRGNSDYFGYSCALGSGKLAVGAPYDDDNGSASGSAYIFNLDGTGEVKLTASDGSSSDQFGRSIAIGSNKVVVGAQYDDPTGSSSGKVYVYNLDGTGEIIITPSDAFVGDQFGAAVAVGIDKIFVSARFAEEDGASNTGIIYSYDLDGTNEVKLPLAVENSDYWGYEPQSMSVGSNRFVVGAQYADTNNVFSSGKIAIYNFSQGASSTNYLAPITNAMSAIAQDIRNASNSHTWDQANTFVNRETLPITTLTSFVGEETALIFAHNTTKTILDSIINNSLITVQGSHGLTQTTDTTITDSTYPAGVHTFVSGVTNAITAGGGASGNFTAASGTTYDPATGVMVIEIGSHSLTTSNTVTIADGGLVFTCDADDNTLQTAYPRSTDPASGQALTITAETATTITVNVGVSVKALTPTGIAYTASTGDMVITSNGHGFTTSDFIYFEPLSLTFKCSSDNYKCPIVHPRPSDTIAYNQVLRISAADTNTFTVNVGASPDDAQHTHQFISATTNAIKKSNYTSSDCADVKSSVNNLMDIIIDTIEEGSGTTTNDTNADHLGIVGKILPAREFIGGRVDAFYEVPLTATAHSGTDDYIYTHQIDVDSRYRYRDAANLIRANASVIVDKASYDLIARYPDLALEMPRNQDSSGDGTLRCKTDMALILAEVARDLEFGGNSNTVTVSKFYVNTNGELQHIRKQVWQSVFAHDRLAFYAKQAINGDLTYDNTDDIITGDWGITNDAVVNFTPTGATYDPATGVMVLTIGTHSLALGRRITIANESLTFTCSQNSNATNHAYPRTTDPASGAKLEIIATTATTITVNVGASSASDQYVHAFVSAAANAVSTAGGCANVESALDTLFQTVNDIIAPTDEDYNIAGDRLYFNRDYIAEEIVGRISAEIQYTVGGNTYQAFTITPSDYDAYIKNIIIAIISDLQTGGNNSTIAELELFLDFNRKVVTVTDELYVFNYAVEQIKELGEFAVLNLLYDNNEGVTGSQYQAVYAGVGNTNNANAYRDALTMTDEVMVSCRVIELVNLALRTITPGGNEARSGYKNIVYNKAYYKAELASIIATQFGSGTWQYDSFIDELLNNIQYDLMTTDTTKFTNSYGLVVSSVTGNFQAGETVSTGSGYTATVLYAQSNLLVTSTFTGGNVTAGDTLTASLTLAACVVDAVPSSTYPWYNSISTVKTIESAASISSLVEGSVDSVNLWTNPEGYETGWVVTRGEVVANVGVAPDNTNTADKWAIEPDTSGQKVIHRDYALSSFTTFDGSGTKFDSGTSTFDTGTDDATQTYTTSVFIKAAQYDLIRFQTRLDNSNSVNFDVDLTTGQLGTLFNSSGGAVTVIDHGAIPFGSGWYRVYATIQFGFGFSTLRTIIRQRNESGLLNFVGTSTNIQMDAFDGSLNSSVSANSYYGRTLAVGDGKIVVGAPFDANGVLTTAGSVFISSEGADPRTSQIKIIPSTPQSNARFGEAVAVGENKVAVGAPFENYNSRSNLGAVYLYDLDGTNEIKIERPTIANSTISNNEYFGRSLAFADDKLFVGCPLWRGVNNAQNQQGAVFVFDATTGDYSNYYIVASDGVASDRFGWDIDTGNNKLVVGAYLDDDGASATGSAYVYNLDGTGEVKINASDAAQNDQFGRAVAIGDGKVLVGAFAADPNGLSSAGKAYVYNLDGTGEISLTPPSTSGGNDQFGWSVAINGDKLAVGSRTDEASGQPSSSGVVTLYDLDGSNATSYTSGDEASNDQFGFAIALSGSKLYGGAPNDDNGSGSSSLANSGSIFIVDIAGGPGVFVWGAKLSNSTLGTYISQSGEEFYANAEFNIKKYSISLIEEYIRQALNNQLASPSANSAFTKFYDSSVAANYNSNSIFGVAKQSLNIITQQLKSSSYYTTISTVNGIPTLTKNYGTRDIPVGISGELIGSDFVYATGSSSRAEVQSIIENEGKIVKVFKRFRLANSSVQNGPFLVNQTIKKQSDAAVTGVIYGLVSDDNFTYLDVEVTAGTFALNDTLEVIEDAPATVGIIDINSTIEDRLQVIDLRGSFSTDIPFKGFTSGAVADPITFLQNEAAVTNNTGGVLTVDTETLTGTLELNSVVYPASSEEYLVVSKYAGLDLQVGQKIASTGHSRFGFNYNSNEQFRSFTAGNRIYKVVNGNRQNDVYGIISEVDTDNNYVYVVAVQGSFTQGDVIGDYGLGGSILEGAGTIVTKVDYAGAASARIQDIRGVGLNKRIYITEISGTFADRDGIRSSSDHRSIILERKIMKARVTRFFRGFDGTQTLFDLTSGNGTQYLPDPAGHMLIFVNGVLQPPGAANSYTAFSDKIQFTEPPDLGASFTGFYVGKLRQLDDISFEFDSLRQSFNLKRNDSFYSLTLTDGVQSTNIRPENNIIVSINGVLQEPGVGFEIVGSRIIFSEIPRVGSTFVAFSYVGSEADVDAEVVVPPVEVNDLLDIEGETTDREVAVIESSNSLITFDYLGSVFGKGAIANTQLTSGYITRVNVTSGGSGYSTRPTVRLDSISGFEGNIRALVGVSNVVVQTQGSGYVSPRVQVDSTVPDDWTAPDLSLYGEEIVDPEIL